MLKQFVFTTIWGLVLLLCVEVAQSESVESRPNIVWIMLEDWGPDLSCYGTPGISTPACDALAAEGIRYTRAFTTAPVCSTSRSAIMTGFHQNYIGANQHRTAPADQKPLPYGIKPLAVLLDEAGYYTCLMNVQKTDCNFNSPLGFEGKDWNGRAAGQPFFAQVTFPGTHRPWQRDPERPIDPADIKLPPYYADTPLVRRDWANGLEQMQLCDREVREILNRLDDEGLAENTLVILIGDHGRCHIRGKQFLYDPGLHIPLLIRWPGVIKPGQVNDELVSSLDITATILNVAEAEPSYKLQGLDLFGPAIKKRKYLFAARDKMDDTHDAMRMIRSRRYKLIHNLMPERPWLQYNEYKEIRYPVLAEMSVLYLAGKLTSSQTAFFAPHKPEFELFDLENDPDEIRNLADDPTMQNVKDELIAELNKWRKSNNDQGLSDEFRQGGWPATYPTKSLEDWQAVVEQWEPWVFRGAREKVPHPFKN